MGYVQHCHSFLVLPSLTVSHRILEEMFPVFLVYLKSVLGLHCKWVKSCSLVQWLV